MEEYSYSGQGYKGAKNLFYPDEAELLWTRIEPDEIIVAIIETKNGERSKGEYWLKPSKPYLLHSFLLTIKEYDFPDLFKKIWAELKAKGVNLCIN